MLKKARYTFFILLTCLGQIVYSQNIEIISVAGLGNNKAACADQYAGEVVLGNVVAQSTQVDLQDTTYLCYQDQFVVLNENADLTGDPNNGTLPGVGYAFYECAPSVNGPTLNDIQNDPCVLDNPVPPATTNLWVYTDQADGTALFQNSNQLGGQTIMEFFNGGDPMLIYFAPITFDNFAQNMDEDGGDCVHTNSAEAFPVVYLNPITAASLTIDGGNPLAGSFIVEGGISEYNGSDYINVYIAKNGNLQDLAQVTGGPFQHGDLVEFEATEAGTYTILIEDGVSCGLVQDIDLFEESQTITKTLTFDNNMPKVGDIVCAEVTVEGFTEIESTDYTLSFNPNVIQFQNVASFGIPNLDMFNFVDILSDNGIVTFQWFDLSASGVTIPDGSLVYEICFEVVGEPGDCSTIDITGNPTEIEVSCCGNQQKLDLIIINDELCIMQMDDIEIIGNSCGANGGSEGTISFKAVGGTPPYNFSITETADAGVIVLENTFFTISNLAAGNYTVNITDDDGNTATLVITVTDSAPIEFNLTETDPICYGLSNGKVKITDLSGGTPDYTIFWSNDIFNVDSIKGLPGGTYSVTVEDDNGCKVTQQAIIGKEPIQPFFEIIDTASCIGVNDGVVQGTAIGGTPFMDDRYTFEFEEPYTKYNFTPLALHDDIPAGMWAVEVTDNVGCIVIDSFFMPYKKEVIADVEVTVADCGVGPGVIEVTAGTTNNSCTEFTFNWSANTGPTTDVGNVSTTEDLPEGFYDVFITDCDGCALTVSSIEMDYGNEVSLTGFTEYNCATGEGCIYVFPGGSGNIMIEWEDGTSNAVRCDLDPGIYSVTATDQSGCSVDTTFVLEVQDFASDTILVTHESCENSMDGSISVEIQGDPDFLWDGPGAPFPNSSIITDLEAGIYFVTIEDNVTQCITFDTIQVLPGDSLTITPNITLPSCNGEQDAVIAVSVAGGQTINDYSFEWSDTAADTDIRTDIGAGTYFLTVYDDNFCSGTVEIDVQDQEQIQIDTTFLSKLDCFGDENAVVIATASGGVSQTGNYGFIWSSGESQSLGMMEQDTAFDIGAPGGFVIVFDEECSDTLNLNLSSPPLIEIDNATTLIDASCFESCDGQAIVQAFGGTGNFSFTWVESGTVGAQITDLCSGYHVVEITDDNNCTVLDSIFIGQPEELELDIVDNATFAPGCNGNEDGQIVVNHTGGNQGPVQYFWTNDVSDTDKAIGLGAGEYTITVLDSKGCTDTTTYELASAPPITADIPTPEDPVCFGERTCVSVDEAFGGSGDLFRFSINNGTLYDLDTCIMVFPGEYLISVFDEVGCSFDTTIIINQPEQYLAELGKDIVVELGDSTTILQLQVSSGFFIDSIYWFSDEPYDCIDPNNCTDIFIYPSQDTEYSVVAIDSEGCIVEDVIFVRVDDERKVYFPNIFSPNGDGNNDRFKPFAGKGVEEILDFKVYDRWGNKVFEIEEPTPLTTDINGWDGTFNGREVDTGTYVYMAAARFVDGRIIQYSGTVTVVH